MSVKGMAIALAMILCATVVQGFPMFKRGRCLCIGPGVKAVKVADIEKASIIYPSNNCDKIEVIITLKENKGQRCLNPKSKQARLIIKLKERILKISKHTKSWKRGFETSLTVTTEMTTILQ
nr:C-X-C motif chemokine 11 isoform X1 [Symphalangus syndactylus]